MSVTWVHQTFCKKHLSSTVLLGTAELGDHSLWVCTLVHYKRPLSHYTQSFDSLSIQILLECICVTLNRSTTQAKYFICPLRNNAQSWSLLQQTAVLHIKLSVNYILCFAGVFPMCCMCSICKNTRAKDPPQQIESSATPRHTHTVIITLKSAVCCVFQHSKWCNRGTVGLKGWAASYDTSQSLPQRGLVSPSASLLCFTLNWHQAAPVVLNTGQEGDINMARDSQSDSKHHTWLWLSRSRASCLCVCWPVLVNMRVCVCVCVCVCVSCLQSFSVICLHLHFLSSHCSSALWLSQHEAETHCAGFIP